MFDRIAGRYDRLNRMMSLGMDRRWRRHLIASLGTPDRALDVATGTADVAIALRRARPTCRVTGLDPSGQMLAVGGAKAARAGVPVDLVRGDAQALPFGDGAFAASCIAFGIRNVPDRPRALREMGRVTRAGGPVAVLELTEPRGGGPLAPLARLHVHRIVPRLGAWLSGEAEYAYLQASIAAFPAPDAFAAQMAEAGLADVRVERLAFGAVHLFVGRAPATGGGAGS